MKCAIALSGGVDSTVAALILKRSGFEVIGLTMETEAKKETAKSDKGQTQSSQTVREALSASRFLDIPFSVVDLSAEFSESVKKPLLEEYSRGRTPNPCIYCNRCIKFGHLLKKARELGCDKMATGHYVKFITSNNDLFLKEAKDKKYDQSYFLYGLQRSVLEYLQFPLGELTKKEVKEIALREGFDRADQPSSQDICFAGLYRGYREYLRSLGDEGFSKGDIVDAEGRVLGKHSGIASYTIGQRKGLGLSMPEPFYVTGLDAEQNIVVAGPRSEAMKRSLRVKGLNLFQEFLFKKSMRMEVKIRYNSPKAFASVEFLNEDEASVVFDEPQFAPAPGQAAVFYDEGRVIGGGCINEVLA